MALQIPNFGQLSPVAPPANPVDRYAKIAAIQDMIQGNQIKQQQLQINQQEQARLQAQAARKDAEYQHISSIFEKNKASANPIDDSINAVLADPYVSAETKKEFQAMQVQRKPDYILAEGVDSEGKPMQVMKTKEELYKQGPFEKFVNPGTESDFKYFSQNLQHEQPLGSPPIGIEKARELFNKSSGSSDPYGERKREEGGKIYIDTYDKRDPQAPTLSTRLEGPYHPSATLQIAGQDAGSVPAWTKLVSTGQAELNDIPNQLTRSAVAKELDKQGLAQVPKQVRQQLTDIDSAKAMIGQIEELAGKISRGEDRAQNTLLLKNETEGMGTLLGRMIGGERGVITDRDRDVVVKLLPGMIGANFAPGYVKAQLDFLKGRVSTQEKAYKQGYFKTVTAPGGQGAPSGGDAKRGTFNPATGKVEYK